MLSSEAKAEEPPIVGADFACMKSDLGNGITAETNGTTLVLADYGTKMIRFTALPTKAVSGYATAFIEDFVRALFHERVILRTDNEPAIMALAKAAGDKLPARIRVQQTP